MTFAELGLAEPVKRAVEAAGYEIPTPIQAQAIPLVIAGGDLLGVAQTGTGKTAAFALPVLHRLYQSTAHSAKPDRQHEGRRDSSQSRSKDRRRIRVLVLSPTRELAVQIGESFQAYGQGTGLRHVVVFGGVSQYHQVKALRAGVDILVATPGRLIDLREQGFIDLSQVNVLVLDEADRMLDMGFLPSVKQIVADIPAQRQTLFFSATMPPEVRDLADSLLRDPSRVEITPVATTAERVRQAVCHIERSLKPRLLRHLLRKEEVTRSLVFTRTKHGADKVVQMLENADFAAEAIHSNRSQAQRQRALNNFKTGRTQVLVATDIAARGIDVDGISHVINFDLPMEIDNYVHRIGRTARAGASGVAISFCSPEERGRWQAIERLIRQRIEVLSDIPPEVTDKTASPTRNTGSQATRPHLTEPGNPGESVKAIVKPRRPEFDAAARFDQVSRRPQGPKRRRRRNASEFNGAGSGFNGPASGSNRPKRFGKPARFSRPKP